MKIENLIRLRIKMVNFRLKKLNGKNELDRVNKLHFLACLALLTFFVFQVNGHEKSYADIKNKRTLRISVLANTHWTDTGIDVVEGQEVYFKASGGISLQKGNPMAYCGPDGYDLKTVQQPIKEKNIGALIGKVVMLISIEVDEETGEEIRNELVEEFYIGSENSVEIPIGGRIFLGINENVVEDNAGEFRVEMRLSSFH